MLSLLAGKAMPWGSSQWESLGKRLFVQPPTLVQSRMSASLQEQHWSGLRGWEGTEAILPRACWVSTPSPEKQPRKEALAIALCLYTDSTCIVSCDAQSWVQRLAQNTCVLYKWMNEERWEEGHDPQL